MAAQLSLRGTPFLYRAMVSTRQYAEVAVFFMASRDQRHEVLNRLLHTAWQIDVDSDLSVCDLSNAAELLDQAFGEPSDGDMRLFECGFAHGAPIYLDQARTHFFVDPATQARLWRAQATANAQMGRAETARLAALAPQMLLTLRSFAAAVRSSRLSDGHRSVECELIDHLTAADDVIAAAKRAAA